ncbi:MAG: hypothetical protein WEC12_03950, partial [Balneolaceae bacterium]
HNCNCKNSGTGGTVSGDYKIAVIRGKSGRQIKPGNRDVFKAKGVFAGRTIKMDVHIIRIGAGAVVGTQGVFGAAAFIMNLMNQPVLLKCFKRTVQSGPVRAGKMIFKTGKTDGRLVLGQIIQNH